MQKGGPSTGRRSRWSAYPTKLLLVEHVVVDTLVSASYLLATIACVVGKCLHQAQVAVERAQVVAFEIHVQIRVDLDEAINGAA
jgi:hypothetical protein